jgi:lipoprotein NlpI
MAASARADGRGDINACKAAEDGGNPQAAIALCTRALNSGELSQGNVVIALNNRATAYQSAGYIDLAMKDIDQAIALWPQHAQSFVNRGNFYDAQGALDRAMQDYEEAIRLEPDLPDAYINRGATYGEQGKLDLEVQDLDKTIQLKPDFALAYSNRGGAYLALGDVDRAIEDYNEAIRLDPSLTMAVISRGVAHFYHDEDPQAVVDFTAVSNVPQLRPYAEIWLALIRKRYHPADPATGIEIEVTEIDGWPAPVLRYYQGKIDRERVLDDARSTDALTERGQKCEGVFYIAAWDLLNAQVEQARQGFERAVADCPLNYIERSDAALALKRM